MTAHCPPADDSLAPARGLTFGVLLGAAGWALIGVIVIAVISLT
jgi:hypothetical protein